MAAGERKKVAVVLSGCGVYDGSEIHEAVSVLVHLSRAGVEARCFAPDIPQADVVNHVKGSPSGIRVQMMKLINLLTNPIFQPKVLEMFLQNPPELQEARLSHFLPWRLNATVP